MSRRSLSLFKSKAMKTDVSYMIPVKWLKSPASFIYDINEKIIYVGTRESGFSLSDLKERPSVTQMSG